LGNLKRSVFLDKHPDVILKRKDSKMRLESFFVGIDILKRSRKWEEKIINKYKCIEIMGYSKERYHISIHLREELKDGDKKLFLISTFYKKTSLP
jgi:hypothetical protein